MEAKTAALGHTGQVLASLAASVIDDRDLGLCSDEQLVRFAQQVGSAIRRLEGLLVETAAQVEARSGARADGEASIDHAHGCRNANELLQRCTGSTGRRAAELLRAARSAQSSVTLAGEELPPFLPALREAMRTGRLGIDGFLAAARPLEGIRSRVDAETLGLADDYLAQYVLGDPGGLITADALGQHAADLATALDQDGPEPTMEEQQRRRSLRLGRLDGGLVRLTGDLVPEAAAQLKRLLNAIDNPRVRFTDPDDDAPRDDRSPAQRAHDAFATILTTAASAGTLPTLNGEAPTLVVNVDLDALESGTGYAFVADADCDGNTAPVHLSVARHTACAGSVLRVFTKRGRCVGIDTLIRCFTAAQRAAIAARDGGCVIPGCTVPPAWCETHHVLDWARGGKTHVDNGVLLCWHHHRTIDSGGWFIEMRDGIPWIKAPAWIDPHGTWRRHRRPARLRT